MMIFFEIVFAVWMLHAFASVFIGLAQILLGLTTRVAAWVLLLLSTVVEILYRLWQTAFGNVES